MAAEHLFAKAARPAANERPDSSIEIREVRQTFGEIVALERIDLNVPHHTRVGIVGSSGCGKSTLLSDIAGLIEPDSGTISIGGATDARERLARCALMPQKDLLLPWRTALDNACLALENRGVKRAEARLRARPLFERFGLAEFEERLPGPRSAAIHHPLSFLRTLMAEKDVLLLDEPFGALDSITRAQMQELLFAALKEQALEALEC